MSGNNKNNNSNGAITKDLEDNGKEKVKGEEEKGDSFKKNKGEVFGKKSPTKDFPPQPSPPPSSLPSPSPLSEQVYTHTTCLIRAS